MTEVLSTDDSKMRIVVNTISTKKGAGGAYQIAYNFLMETLKHQDEVEWYYITSADVDELVDKEFENVRGKRYFVFPTQPDFKGSYRQVKKELAEWEKRYKPDVIYTISSPCYFSFKTPEVMRFANAWITNPNNYAWASMPWKEWIRMRLYRINQKRMLRKAKYIITQSETVRKGLLGITGLNGECVKVVPNVLPNVFASAEVSPKKKNEWIDVICAAAPVPHKNLDIIPGVLSVLKKRYGIENVRFHLTIPDGNSILNRIVMECESLGLADRIVNHGRCTQQQLCGIYNSCDICFLPTLLETFSASSLEAMYFGLSIVATDFDFNKEVIQEAGLYFEPMNAEDAAGKIALLIEDKNSKNLLEGNMKKRLPMYKDYGNHFDEIKSFLIEVANNCSL